MILSYQEESSIGSEYLQVHIFMIPSYRRSCICNERVQAHAIMITSYQELSRISSKHVQVHTTMVWFGYDN